MASAGTAGLACRGRGAVRLRGVPSGTAAAAHAAVGGRAPERGRGAGERGAQAVVGEAHVGAGNVGALPAAPAQR